MPIKQKIFLGLKNSSLNIDNVLRNGAIFSYGNMHFMKMQNAYKINEQIGRILSKIWRFPKSNSILYGCFRQTHYICWVSWRVHEENLLAVSQANRVCQPSYAAVTKYILGFLFNVLFYILVETEILKGLNTYKTDWNCFAVSLTRGNDSNIWQK